MWLADPVGLCAVHVWWHTALQRAQEERRNKEKSGCFGCLRCARGPFALTAAQLLYVPHGANATARPRRGGGGGGGGGEKKKKSKPPKEKKTPKEKKPPKEKKQAKKGKAKAKSRSDSDSDDALSSDSDEEIDAEALMRKYGLTPEDGAPAADALL